MSYLCLIVFLFLVSYVISYNLFNRLRTNRRWESDGKLTLGLSHNGFLPHSDNTFLKYTSNNIPYIEVKYSNGTQGGTIRQLNLYVSYHQVGKGDSGLIHIELHGKRIWKRFPRFLRPKPIAKAGIRNYSTSRSLMSDMIRGIYPDVSMTIGSEKGQYYSTMNTLSTSEIDNNPTISSYSTDIDSKSLPLIPVAIFVYMWVNPSYRGLGLGDILLRLSYRKIKELGLGDYMLLIHDDKGSGKLIRYYKSRGFNDVSDFIEKGMIIRIPRNI